MNVNCIFLDNLMLEFITPIFLKQVMGLNTHRLSPWYYKQASHRQCHRKSFPAIFSNFFRASFNRSPVNCISTEYTLFSQNPCFQFMFWYRIEFEYNTICIIHTIYGFLREFFVGFQNFFFFFYHNTERKHLEQQISSQGQS